MSEISFGDNYSDISENTGFQFEFYCEHCRDAWRTPYKKYLAGSASNFLGTASSMLGGIFGSASNVADQLRDAGYKAAHDKAFQEAVQEAKDHFHRCRRCSNYLCGQCYNPNLNLCTACAPSIEEEANVAAREAEIEMA
ncbi:MAG: zinc ribbon domain-containing protein, partial [Armatimonadetes bacterium]|nr:zinc ribbon domain-containing protein [Armatimonadota bacterium]